MLERLRGELGDEELLHLASLRPSRVRECATGRPWTTVALVDIEESGAAALRAALETFGVRVDRYPVGSARALVHALADAGAAPYVILACHGDDGDIVLPGLAEELERFQPFRERLRPDDVRAIARFDGGVVIATGCDTGRESLAHASSKRARRRTSRRPARRSATRAYSRRSSCSTS